MLLVAGQTCARDNNGQTPLHCVAHAENSVAAVHALLAAGADLDVANDAGESARQVLARRGLTINPSQVEAARRVIAKARLDFVHDRALEMCIGLQSLELDALQMCKVLQFACGPVAPLIPFHIWWKIATTVKHFRTKYKMKMKSMNCKTRPKFTLPSTEKNDIAASAAVAVGVHGGAGTGANIGRPNTGGCIEPSVDRHGIAGRRDAPRPAHRDDVLECARLLGTHDVCKRTNSDQCYFRCRQLEQRVARL
jgi:hypothetical protein